MASNDRTTVLDRYSHYHYLDKVIRVVDSSGTLTATYSYDAYGNLPSSTGTLSNDFRYTGESTT